MKLIFNALAAIGMACAVVGISKHMGQRIPFYGFVQLCWLAGLVIIALEQRNPRW